MIRPILEANARMQEIQSRLVHLEQRFENRRHRALDELVDYLVGAQLPGDYLEFGVYKGWTFSYACKLMASPFPNMRFFAFDSFEGLPRPRGVDALDDYTSNFQESEFACTRDEFLDNLELEGVPLDRVITVKGWFDEVLTPQEAVLHGIQNIAAAWIDCDLYESTIPVLRFITPYLSVGSVLLFDDWRCFRNHPDFGEQRACREWLAQNPSFALNELFSFGWHGIAFTVVSAGND